MSRFIVLSTVFMGWAFYEMSGGAEFEPATKRTVAATPPAATEPTTDTGQPSESETARVAAAPARAPAPKPRPTPQITPAVATAEEPLGQQPAAPVAAKDLRHVTGSRVNMRSGPGTQYGVLATLRSGDEAEVLSTDDRGWAKIRVAESGRVGWMAERFLSDAAE